MFGAGRVVLMRLICPAAKCLMRLTLHRLAYRHCLADAALGIDLKQDGPAPAGRYAMPSLAHQVTRHQIGDGRGGGRGAQA